MIQALAGEILIPFSAPVEFGKVTVLAWGWRWQKILVCWTEKTIMYKETGILIFGSNKCNWDIHPCIKAFKCNFLLYYPVGGWWTGSPLNTMPGVSSLEAIETEPERGCQSQAPPLHGLTQGLGHHNPHLSPSLQPLQKMTRHSAGLYLSQHRPGNLWIC